MSTQQTTKSNITLKGSTEIVTEFFGYSINNILFQRGIYPPDSFKKVTKYGLGLMVTSDDGLKQYLSKVLNQLSDWLMKNLVKKLVLVVSGVESKMVLERWSFDIECDGSAAQVGSDKALSEVTKEIQAIMRQITSSVSYLPLLNEPCVFDLLVYTDKETQVPGSWEESDPKFVANSAKVRLRSFTTKVHKIDACVTYATDDVL